VIPDLDTVVRLLQVDEARVHSVFLTGSRLYGCARSDSDVDLVAVVDGAARDLVFGKGVDLVVYGVDAFRSALGDQRVHAIACWSTPVSSRVRSGPAFGYVLDRARLRERAAETVEADWRKAARTFAHDPDGARARAVHGLRVAAFARQIATHGRVVDFAAANDVREAVLTDPADDWAHYEHTYGALRAVS
jgi:hypothetical protein